MEIKEVLRIEKVLTQIIYQRDDMLEQLYAELESKNALLKECRKRIEENEGQLDG